MKLVKNLNHKTHSTRGRTGNEVVQSNVTFTFQVYFVAVVGVFFGVRGPVCEGTWVPVVYPIAALLTALGTALTYTIFMLGWAEEDPDRLVKVVSLVKEFFSDVINYRTEKS